MSNKIVPTIYRAVIDDVITSIKPEFEEYGVSEDVLAELQAKWESKVVASHVAEFEIQHTHAAPQHHAYQPHPMHMMPNHPYGYQAPGQPHVKTEPVDPRYMLNGPPPVPYTLPPLPGPQLAARPPPSVGGQQSILSFPPGPPPIQAQPMQNGAAIMGRQYVPPGGPAQASASRIPQVDGPSNSDDDDSPSPPAGYAPRSSHPSLPQPQSQSRASASNDEEAINSDLDDSESENEEENEDGAAGESDIVFCTYDKVARVKNKWKCVLKDGMIHVNGRDYLFQKCTGEFEW
ncbi:transcription factor IIA alpha/beta subunit [Mycena floridula]|nr:transcription factor IIA alpha/beta subunit [Mycena floridula]